MIGRLARLQATRVLADAEFTEPKKPLIRILAGGLAVHAVALAAGCRILPHHEALRLKRAAGRCMLPAEGQS